MHDYDKLGYIKWKMDNNGQKNKSIYTGHASEHLPESSLLYFDNRVKSSTPSLVWRCLLLQTRMGDEDLTGDAFNSHALPIYDLASEQILSDCWSWSIWGMLKCMHESMLLMGIFPYTWTFKPIISSSDNRFHPCNIYIGTEPSQ